MPHTKNCSRNTCLVCFLVFIPYRVRTAVQSYECPVIILTLTLSAWSYEHLRWQTSAALQVGRAEASQPFPLAAASHSFWISEQFLSLHLTASITHLFTLDLSLLKSSLHFEQAKGNPYSYPRNSQCFLEAKPSLRIWCNCGPSHRNMHILYTPLFFVSIRKARNLRYLCRISKEKNPGFTWYITYLPLNYESSHFY